MRIRPEVTRMWRSHQILLQVVEHPLLEHCSGFSCVKPGSTLLVSAALLQHFASELWRRAACSLSSQLILVQALPYLRTQVSFQVGIWPNLLSNWQREVDD